MYTVFYGKYQPIVNELLLKVIQPSNFGAIKCEHVFHVNHLQTWVLDLKS